MKPVYLIVLGLLAIGVCGENIQPVIIYSDVSFYNTTVVVCSTNSICDDITNQTFYSTTNRTSTVVYLDNFNSTYNEAYWYSIYIDDILLSNQTKGYLGRSGVINDNVNVTGNLTVNSNTYLDHNVFLTGITGSNTYKVGIGTDTPAYQLHVSRSGGGGARGIMISQHNDAIAAPLFLFRKSGGDGRRSN